MRFHWNQYSKNQSERKSAEVVDVPEVVKNTSKSVVTENSKKTENCRCKETRGI